MEMDAYERLVDRAEDAKEMLDEDVKEYMNEIKIIGKKIEKSKKLDDEMNFYR